MVNPNINRAQLSDSRNRLPNLSKYKDSILSLMEGQNQVLEKIAQGQPLSTVLDKLALVIEAHAEVTTYCSFLLFDEQERRLRHGAAPSLPVSYCQAIDGVKTGPCVGSCGTAAHYNASVIVEDINIDPLWSNYREIAKSHNLRACWSTPILNYEGRILATFAMYHPFPYKPTAHDRKLLEKATYLARIAIERYHTEIALKETNDSLEQQVTERTQDLNTAIQQLQKQIHAREKVEEKLRQKAEDLEETLQELRRTQSRMLHSEKMSSLGQLVAGVAHEINNPVNFIHGNLKYLQEQIPDVLEAIRIYEQQDLNLDLKQQEKLEELDIDFLQEDISKILQSMSLGTERISQIVLSLRTFSRIDEADFKSVNIHDGIESTLLILQHQLRANSERGEIAVAQEYEELPLINCYAGALNQVFMNILGNAIDAINMKANESCQNSRVDDYQITIKTISTKYSENYDLVTL